MTKRPLTFLLTLITGLITAETSVMAHPHVWVAVQSEVVFGNDGRIVGVRHSWEFDEMYSAFATQGLGKNGAPPTKEELAPLAKTNIESLAEFDYFTFAKQNNEKPAFKPPQDVTLEVNERKSVVMHFFFLCSFPPQRKSPFLFRFMIPPILFPSALKRRSLLG